MEIDVLVEADSGSDVDAAWVKKVAEKALIAQSAAENTELSLVLVGQQQIIELNKQYFGKDRATDVISFSLTPGEEFVAPPDGKLHLGEVVISYPQAVVQAQEQGHTVKKELAVLIVHGILHLFGYEDEEPALKRKMRAREKEVLESIEGEIA